MSAGADRLIAPLREILAGDGWVPGSVAMNKLDAVAAALAAAEAQLVECKEVSRGRLDLGYAIKDDLLDALNRAEAAEAQRATLAEAAAALSARLRTGHAPTLAEVNALDAALAGVAPPEEQP